jgi:gas vesicle protein
MCDCKDCDCQGNDSGFIFGLVIGAVIGAAVAVYIYKNNKSDVFGDLKEKLEGYFKGFANKSSKSEKIAVILPKKIVKESTPAKTITVKPRKFVKPKK